MKFVQCSVRKYAKTGITFALINFLEYDLTH